MATCINCTRQALPNEDFCQICLDRVDHMVDNRELQEHDRVEIAASPNPFISSQSMTGRIGDREDSIASSVDLNDDDSGNYWSVIIILVLILVLMASYFL